MRSAFALRIVSGRTILNFGVQKRLRAFLNPIFTDGVVTENGICSAAFCESVALRESGLALSVTFGDSSPKGRALGMAGKFADEPSQSRLPPCQLPRRGSLYTAAGLLQKSSPFGGAGKAAGFD